MSKYQAYLQVLLSARLCAVVGDDGVVLPGEDGLRALVCQQRREHEDLALLLGEHQGFSRLTIRLLYFSGNNFSGFYGAILGP